MRALMRAQSPIVLSYPTLENSQKRSQNVFLFLVLLYLNVLFLSFVGI